MSANDALARLLRADHGTVVLGLLTQADLARARCTSPATRAAIEAGTQQIDNASSILLRNVTRLHEALEDVTRTDQQGANRLDALPAGVNGVLAPRRPDGVSPSDVRRASCLSATSALVGLAGTSASAVEFSDLPTDPTERALWGSVFGVAALGFFVASRYYVLQAAAFRRTLAQQNQAVTGAQLSSVRQAFDEAREDLESAWCDAVREQADERGNAAKAQAGFTPLMHAGFNEPRSVVEDRV